MEQEQRQYNPPRCWNPFHNYTEGSSSTGTAHSCSTVRRMRRSSRHQPEERELRLVAPEMGWRDAKPPTPTPPPPCRVPPAFGPRKTPGGQLATTGARRDGEQPPALSSDEASPHSYGVIQLDLGSLLPYARDVEGLDPDTISAIQCEAQLALLS